MICIEFGETVDLILDTTQDIEGKVKRAEFLATTNKEGKITFTKSHIEYLKELRGIPTPSLLDLERAKQGEKGIKYTGQFAQWILLNLGAIIL